MHGARYFPDCGEEDPVHYQADSPFGPFWSVTRFDDIVAVDSNHEVFSSEPSIVLADFGDDLPPKCSSRWIRPNTTFSAGPYSP